MIVYKILNSRSSLGPTAGVLGDCASVFLCEVRRQQTQTQSRHGWGRPQALPAMVRPRSSLGSPPTLVPPPCTPPLVTKAHCASAASPTFSSPCDPTQHTDAGRGLLLFYKDGVLLPTLLSASRSSLQNTRWHMPKPLGSMSLIYSVSGCIVLWWLYYSSLDHFLRRTHTLFAVSWCFFPFLLVDFRERERNIDGD